MGKRTNCRYYMIQGALIVLSVAVLLLLRHQIIQAGTSRMSNVFMIIVLVVFVTGSVILVLAGLFGAGRSLRSREGEASIVRLQRQARIDSLTELLTRDEAKERITDYLSTSGRQGSHTLFIIDLDNFKSVNDTFGHQEGDRVLKNLAAKLRAVFRPDDVVGRLGGDEFIVLMKNAAAADRVRKKAAELLSALEYMTSGGDLTVTVTGSIGISTYCDGKEFETLYREADEALYRAKQAGKNRFSHYDWKDMASRADVTGQTALRESSASIQLKALIDNIDGGIALVEIDDEIRAIYLSRSCVRVMQLSYEGIKQADNRFLAFIEEEDAGPAAETLRHGAQSNESVEAVFRKQVENGRTRWYHMRAVRIPYEGDKPVMLAIITDVSNLKRVELDYEAQKKQLETVLKVCDIVTFEVDIYKHILYVSDATVKKYGIDTHVIENMPESLIKIGAIHPDSVDECRRMYDEIYNGVKRGSAIIRTMKTNGQYTLERFTYFSVYDSKGRPSKVIGIAESLNSFRMRKFHFESLEKQFRHYTENTLISIKTRLSQDSLEPMKNEGPLTWIWRNQETYSGFLASFASVAVYAEDQERIKQMFSTDGLRSLFNRGEDIISWDFEMRTLAGEERFYTISAIMFADHLDEEIYAFIRVQDKTGVKQLECLTGVRLKYIPKLMCYSFEMLCAAANALVRLKNKNRCCAVLIFSIVNFEMLQVQYGLDLINVLLSGFIGKIRMVFQTDHIISYNGDGSITVLIPKVESDEWLINIIEQAIGFLKKPAYFQFYEEDLLEYRCGVSVEGPRTAGFDELFAEAKRALDCVSKNDDQWTGFYRQAGRA